MNKEVEGSWPMATKAPFTLNFDSDLSFEDFNKNVKRNLNDYNINFLPKTEFLNLKFTKIMKL